MRKFSIAVTIFIFLLAQNVYAIEIVEKNSVWLVRDSQEIQCYDEIGTSGIFNRCNQTTIKNIKSESNVAPTVSTSSGKGNLPNTGANPNVGLFLILFIILIILSLHSHPKSKKKKYSAMI